MTRKRFEEILAKLKECEDQAFPSEAFLVRACRTLLDAWTDERHQNGQCCQECFVNDGYCVAIIRKDKQAEGMNGEWGLFCRECLPAIEEKGWVFQQQMGLPSIKRGGVSGG